MMVLANEIQICQCGATTVFVGKENYSFITKPEGLDISQADKLNDCYMCNHCVNHWGTVLCKCGSGESPTECKEDCGEPSQVLGVPYKFIGWA